MNLERVAERLEAKFGRGTRPELRCELYRRLQQLVELEGPRAYVVIASAAVDAEGKQNPGRYFAHVVMCRLKERGVLPVAEV